MEIEKTKVTQLELAEALGVTQPTLSEATSKGYYCAGRPVSEWAHTGEKGRLEHYEVPASLVNEEQDDKEDLVEEDGPASHSEESAEKAESFASDGTTEEKSRVSLKESFGALAVALGVKTLAE
jgi:transcriptional regulator with XRE-family HTH domain